MEWQTLVIGAGAAGMMCAAEAGPGTLVVDHARAPGEKIRISGGGRCNFTNLGASPDQFLSGNPHFCKSALKRYTQWDFLDLVGRHGIAWHEKTLGQLFCDGSAKQIVAMLLAEMRAAGAELRLSTSVIELSHGPGGFTAILETEGRRSTHRARSVVVACGGKSIPKMGASDLGYRIARQFGVPVTETRPGLVPLTFSGALLDELKSLAGVAAPSAVGTGGARFEEALLFTHRGLSGPAILQASSYWREGAEIAVDLLPGASVAAHLRGARAQNGRRSVATALAEVLPARLARHLAGAVRGNLADQSDARIEEIAARVQDWRLLPSGTEGYRTAEVTLGGVDTEALESRTMAVKALPGLHFIGEVVDVTGWLGGYNFQWAWSSGWAAGQALRETTGR